MAWLRDVFDIWKFDNYKLVVRTQDDWDVKMGEVTGVRRCWYGNVNSINKKFICVSSVSGIKLILSENPYAY